MKRVGPIALVALASVAFTHLPLARALSRGQLVESRAGVSSPLNPRALLDAYDVDPLLRAGITGKGRTVAVLAGVDPGHGTTNIFRDVAAFDRRFGFPPVKLRVTSEPGVPRVDWDVAWGEEASDIEIVHAVAPGASVQVLLESARSSPEPSARTLT